MKVLPRMPTPKKKAASNAVPLVAFVIIAALGLFFFSSKRMSQPQQRGNANVPVALRPPVTITLADGWESSRTTFMENAILGGGPPDALLLQPTKADPTVDATVDILSYTFRPDAVLNELPDLLLQEYVPTRDLVTRQNIQFADRDGVRLVTRSANASVEGEPFQVSVYLARINVREILEVDVTYPTEEAFSKQRSAIADMLDTLVITE